VDVVGTSVVTGQFGDPGAQGRVNVFVVKMSDDGPGIGTSGTLVGTGSSGCSTLEVGSGCWGSSGAVVEIGSSGAGDSVSGGGGRMVSVIGHKVVETGIVCVTTVVEPSEQSGISGPQSVMVCTDVVKIVDVLMWVVVTGSVTVMVSSGGGESEVGCSGNSSEVGCSGNSSEVKVSVGPGGSITDVSGSSGTSVDVMGQTVVEIGVVCVTTVVDPSGQSGTSGPQLVMVETDVVNMVDVVRLWGGVVSGILKVPDSDVGSSGDSSEVDISGNSTDEEVSGSGVGSGAVVPGSSEIEVRVGSGAVVPGSSEIEVRVIGQMVVEIAMVCVTTVVEPSGQSGTSGPQLVMVVTDVVKMVDVVRLSGGVGSGAVVGTGWSLDKFDTVVDGISSVGGGWDCVESVASADELAVVGVGEVVDGESDPVDTVEVTSSLVSETDPVSVTGHTVVEIGIVSVTITVESPGQSGTSGAQDVMVCTVVVKMVDVVICCDDDVVMGWADVIWLPDVAAVVILVVGSRDDSVADGSGVVESAGSVVGTSVIGQTVVEMAMVSVVTMVEPSGQSGTSGPQSVIVWVVVVKIVDVVKLWEVVSPGKSDEAVVTEAGAVETVVKVAGGELSVAVETEATDVVGGREDVVTTLSVVGPDVADVVGGSEGVVRALVGGNSVDGDSDSESVAVIGQTVVEIAIVSVTSTGPFGHDTSGAHEVMVWTVVVKMVEVVNDSDSSEAPETVVFS
jgi:hypothetical protein